MLLQRPMLVYSRNNKNQTIFSSGVYRHSIICSRCSINGDLTLIHGGEEVKVLESMSLVGKYRELP